MEINMKEILARMNLRQITYQAFDQGFALDDTTSENQRSYAEHLKEGGALLLKRLREVYAGDKDAHSDAVLEYTSAVSAYRDVYTEIGMKIGARLLFQLLCQDD